MRQEAAAIVEGPRDAPSVEILPFALYRMLTLPMTSATLTTPNYRFLRFGSSFIYPKLESPSFVNR